MNHTRNSKVNIFSLIRGRRLTAFFLSVLMLLTALPMTVYAGSVGSISTDKLVGEDVMQNASTTYENVESGSAGTDVYLTVDNGTIVVGVPTVVILSGNSDENGEYKGNYSVYAKGDMSGDQVLNIYPETDTVVMKQKGKLNKSASVSQIKTEFSSEDIVDGMTVTGDISAEGLTAGSWNGNFNFVISMISRAVYYSSLERAVADANNLTTENADVKREDVENAVAALYIQDSTAYIRMMNDESNVQSMTISQNAVIDLNNYTVTFAEGQYLTYNQNLSVLNGVINAVDSNYVISGSSTDTASTLSLRDLSLNETVTENIKTHAYQVNSYSLNNNLDNVEINTTGNGNSSHGVYGINFRNENSVNEVNNYSFISDVINPIKIRGTQVNGNTTLNKPFINISNNTEIVGIHAGNASNKTIVNNANIKVSSNSSDKGIEGIDIRSKMAEINGCDVYVDAPNAENGAGIILYTTESAVINSTIEHPVTVYGKEWCLETSPYGTITINGGTYTSTNHTAYIGGNADIHDAKFYIDRTKGSVSSDCYGVYVGSKSCSADAVVNFYNCTIGNPDSFVNSKVAITSQRNYGYQDPAEVNLYNCDLYTSNDMFKYNFGSSGKENQTKFNLYGDTHLYRRVGSSYQEYTKEEIQSFNASWRTDVYSSITNTSFVGNKFICYQQNNSFTPPSTVNFVHVKSDAGVYDYR